MHETRLNSTTDQSEAYESCELNENDSLYNLQITELFDKVSQFVINKYYD